MFKALGRFEGGDGFVDMSFRRTDLWDSMSTSNPNSRVAGTAVHSTALLFGDEKTGPAMVFLALGPHVKPPDAPAHGHASDTWRLPVLGNLPMGPDAYDAGEFRFQQGWKPYASDNYANGPEGGWTALLFGDRRGIKSRHVAQHGEGITPMDRMLAEWLGIDGDLVTDDPTNVPAPSTLATTLDDLRTGARINGSFHDTTHWMTVDRVQIAAGLLGHSESGPMILLAKVPAGGRCLGNATLGCDVFRLVARGSNRIDGREYVMGDMRVQAGGVALGTAVAGPDGVDEVVIIADRREVNAAAIHDDLWRQLISAAIDDLAVRQR